MASGLLIRRINGKVESRNPSRSRKAVSINLYARMIGLCVLQVCVCSGCQMLQPQSSTPAAADGRAPLPPSLARMQKVYPDLEKGKFVCLADFNTMPQATLFRMLDANGTETEAQPEISVRRSIDETGAGGLHITFENPQEQLRFDGARSSTLALPRDWSPYTLLLFNVYGPNEGTILEFSVESGTDVPLRFSRRVQIEPGWHLCKYDLAELSDDIDLTDVRALCWRPVESTEPVELFFDDFLLTDNTRYVLGEHAAPGELYLLACGRRILVGAKDAFELAFSDGVICEWRLTGGPNLTVRSGLGPWPMPLPADWHTRQDAPLVYDDPQLFAAWGARVAARQSVIEASPTRIVLEGQWRFFSTDAAASPEAQAAGAETPAEHTWRYVIYPTGQAFVTVTSNCGAHGWPGERVGYAIAVGGRVGFARVLPEPYGTGPAATYVLLSQAGRDKPDLLWCLQDSRGAERQLELVSGDERRIAITIGDLAPEQRIETAHLLRFLPCDMDSHVEGYTFAADYQNPATITAARGQQITEQAGDLNHDGFNESDGCYEMALDNGILRFTLSDGGILRHFPRFRVSGAADRECWIYSEGRIVPAGGRDANGNLFFTLPQTLNAAASVEIVSSPANGSSKE